MSAGSEVDSDIWTKVFERPKNVVSRKIAGECFLVPVAGNLADLQRLFALTVVAEFIWERLDARKTLSDIRGEVLARFDAEKDQVDDDLQAFVAELMTEGLLVEAAK